jgi:predicted nucleotidyltransferase
VIDEAVIAEVGRRLHEAEPTARVILFGSSARSETRRHSDLDFLVMMAQVDNAAEESVRSREALGDLLVPMDIIVMREPEVEEWRDVRGTLAHAASPMGRVRA